MVDLVTAQVVLPGLCAHYSELGRGMLLEEGLTPEKT